jgi:hypothetical protein
LQKVVQEKSASLVALSFDNLPQLRPRSNPALTVEYTLVLMSALGQNGPDESYRRSVHRFAGRSLALLSQYQRTLNGILVVTEKALPADKRRT